MESIPLNEARRNLPTLINDAQSKAIAISRHGIPAAVVISPSHYEELIAAFEDLGDLALIKASLADPTPSVPWEQIKKDYGSE
jgi:prevent-host-death family protein